jgi:3'-phosphoadenosine 5'-phosphosulfate sulfotransferase (PAPS reductase)/FAD synthetase
MLLPFLSAFFTVTLLPHLLSANPPFADRAKHRHDKVIVCVSGGKDSVVALLAALAIYGRERVVAHHCLVEEDWERTVEYIQGLCEALGVPLSISQARYYGYECLDCGHRYLRQAEIQVCTKCKSTNGRLVKIVSNLLDLVEWRQKWPDKRVRYCTDYLKIQVLNLWADENRYWLGEHPLVVIGERWSESTSRAELPEVRRRPTRAYLTEFRPVLALRRIEVFRIIREAGLSLHYCYALQWKRLLQEDHRKWRNEGIVPRISYEGQWDGLDQVELLSNAILDPIIERLMYEVDEEGGPRMSCVLCVFKSIIALATSASVKSARRHFDRAEGIEATSGHYIKKNHPIKDIVACVPDQANTQPGARTVSLEGKVP